MREGRELLSPTISRPRVLPASQVQLRLIEDSNQAGVLTAALTSLIVTEDRAPSRAPSRDGRPTSGEWLSMTLYPAQTSSSADDLTRSAKHCRFRAASLLSHCLLRMCNGASREL